MALLCLGTSTWAGPGLSPSAPDGLRPGGTLGEALPAPAMAIPLRDTTPPPPAHPYLPPVIPHHVRDHQLDLNANRCLSCHDVTQAGRMQAPAMSPTHYRDRDGVVTEQVAGSRYFCLSCHVPQHRVTPVMGTRFGLGEGTHASLDR